MATTLGALYAYTADNATIALFVANCVYFFLRLIYRLVYHPLAGYPGPKLAGATNLVEFYYDFFRGGQYVFKIKEWHERYGPIIRIRPDEVHIFDADALLSDIFTHNVTRRREKGEVSTRLFGAPQAMIATVDHDRHRLRRSVMARLFSTESVRRIDRFIQGMVEQLFSRMDDFARADEPINLFLLYSAFTGDVITEYAFAESHNYLQSADLNRGFFDMVKDVHEMGPILKYFQMEEMGRRIRAVKNNVENSYFEKLDHRTVFDETLTSDLPEEEKTVERLWQEAEIVVVAGTETTAWALSVITYHLLSDPVTLKKLRKELLETPSEGITWKKLEKLPYLTAAIQEGLRLSFGVTARFVRVCPEEVIRYEARGKSWEIPPGVCISTSGPLYHLDPTIFPQPSQYRPERWLARDQRLDKYLWSFSKGSRQCLGMSLAYAEMYLILFAVFRKFDGPNGEGLRLELYETTEKDVAFKRDLFVPYPSRGSQGVRVKVRSGD